jgi:hypothetical protein
VQVTTGGAVGAWLRHGFVHSLAGASAHSAHGPAPAAVRPLIRACGSLGAMATVEVQGVEGMQSLLGREIGPSEWRTVCLVYTKEAAAEH